MGENENDKFDNIIDGEIDIQGATLAAAADLAAKAIVQGGRLVKVAREAGFDRGTSQQIGYDFWAAVVSS